MQIDMCMVHQHTDDQSHACTALVHFGKLVKCLFAVWGDGIIPICDISMTVYVVKHALHPG